MSLLDSPPEDLILDDDGDDKPKSFSLSFENDKGISFYVYNSAHAVELRVCSIILENFKRRKKTCLMTNDKDLAKRYFMEVFALPTLRRSQQKLIEVSQGMYRCDDAEDLIYPDLGRLDVSAMKQAMRLAEISDMKIYVFCSRTLYERAKTSPRSTERRLLDMALKSHGSQIVI